MRVICSWCGKSLGEKPPLDDKSISHGMCEECYKRELTGLKEESTMEYTKGEWVVKQVLSEDYFISNNDDEICYPIARMDSHQLNPEANAQLIAAAPDMYKALKSVLSSAVCNDDMSTSYAIDRTIKNQIDNALAKAGL